MWLYWFNFEDRIRAELNKDSAAELFASMQIKPGKLSDDELDSVAGGCRGKYD